MLNYTCTPSPTEKRWKSPYCGGPGFATTGPRWCRYLIMGTSVGCNAIHNGPPRSCTLRQSFTPTYRQTPTQRRDRGLHTPERVSSILTLYSIVSTNLGLVLLPHWCTCCTRNSHALFHLPSEDYPRRLHNQDPAARTFQGPCATTLE